MKLTETEEKIKALTERLGQVCPSDIAKLLGVKSTTAKTYLDALHRRGALTRKRIEPWGSVTYLLSVSLSEASKGLGIKGCG
jgi:predicted ArsR family transcriptional regulator